MNDRATLQAELLLLCGKVRDDTLTPGDAARLDELLRADDKAMQLYVRYMSVASLLESRGMGQRVTSETPEQSEAIDHDLFAELLELEEQAEAELVELAKPIHLRIAAKKTPWQIGGALRWVAKQPAFWSSAAAVFVVATVLTFIFTSGDKSDPIADNALSFDTPHKPAESAPPILRNTPGTIVATLTAEHDATWASASSAPGSPLRAGQRLTLTQGLAEITTARGAVAILEAPTTIELMDNDNAIHLHAGKLVGICDAPLSKGFLVRTPHLDVTDTGTRFGVDATSPLATEIHVLDGSVRVEDRLTRSGGSAQTLSMGQAARVSDQAQGIARIDHNPSSFDAITPIVIELPGTGNDLKQILDQQKQGQVENLRLKRIGEVDRNWLVVAREGQPLERPGIPKVVSPKLYGAENADPSQWLQWSRTKRPDDHQETFLFQTEVTVPGSIDARSASISLACATDNRLLAIHVNGQRIAVEPGDTNDYGMDPYVIDQHLVAGVNTIGFEVMNNWRPGKDYTSNGVALRVSWQLHGMPQQGTSPTDSN